MSRSLGTIMSHTDLFGQNIARKKLFPGLGLGVGLGMGLGWDGFC